METKYLVFNEGREGEVVEKIGEIFPNIGIAIFTQTLVIKPIYLRDLPGLVISSKNRDALRIADLQAHQEGDRFHRVVSTVDIVTLTGKFIRHLTHHKRGRELPTHKQIIRVGIRASNAEELH